MELRQLEYLVAVAEEANFTRAAQRVHISQSGVSAQIRQLEHELGATLIDRSARTATLTDAGKAAVEHARAALSAAAAVRQSVDEVNGLLRGHLTVGMVTACTITALFDALAAFHRGHPGVTITLVEDNSAALTDRVRAGTAEIALIGASGEPLPGLAALPLVSERLVAAGAPNYFTERPGLTLAGLTAFPLICMPRGTGIRTVFDQACAAGGVRADIALEASAPTAVADLAARGLGVAILSQTIAASLGGRLRVRLIEDVRTPALLSLVWKPAPGPALGQFLRHCRTAFAAFGDLGGGPAAGTAVSVAGQVVDDQPEADAKQP
jgi:DNA-binding transcriptional LysR family regulator